MNQRPKDQQFRESDSWDYPAPFDENEYYSSQAVTMGGVEFGQEKNHVGRGPKGYRRSDERIFEVVCEALTHNPRVDAGQIEVQVKDGLVYLRGIVSSRAEKKEAEYCLEHLSGIRDIQNELHLKS